MAENSGRKAKLVSRRAFSVSSFLGGAVAASCLVRNAHATQERTDVDQDLGAKYGMLDDALSRPVLETRFFDSPIVIENVELLRNGNNFLYRVRSKNGAVGVAVGHPHLARLSWPVMRDLKAQFTGKDARALDSLVMSVSEPGAKTCGVPKNVHIAALEIAVLDMLGNISGKPIGELLGGVHHPHIAVYLGSRYGELRSMEPEKSLALLKKDVEESNAKAVKIRGGVGDQLGTNADNAPGRTEKLIRMTRELFGDDMVLMLDGNGSYSYDEAVRIGRLLEEYGYFFYEEPIPWDWYEEQRRVANTLDIPMAGGEEEFRLRAFRWLIANDAFDIVQPDQLYFGGMIRSMKVARMAEAFGKPVVPHMTTGGLGYLYMLHYVSACPNAGRYHEFKMFATPDANGTMIPIQSKTKPFASVDGVIEVPTGPGLGIEIDPDYIGTHKLVEDW